MILIPDMKLEVAYLNVKLVENDIDRKDKAYINKNITGIKT